jgi:mRNA-degrading endonuclease RelE of RelBE toxin-antitoxin system
MGYKVILFSSAVKDFDALPAKEKSRVAEVLRSFADYSYDLQGIKKLQLPLYGYRKKVGNYRILFTIKDTSVYVHSIKHRKDAYR